MRTRQDRASMLLVSLLGVGLALVVPALDPTTLAPRSALSSSTATADEPAQPKSASIVIDKGAATRGYTTPKVTITQDGTLTVVNLDTIDHTVTSEAVDADGDPLFDVRVRPGTTRTVPAASALAAGTYAFFCTFHPNMRGELTVEGDSGGVAPSLPAFELPLAVPEVRRSKHVRLRMRANDVRMLPDGPRTTAWTFGGTWPGPTIRRPAGREVRVSVANDLPKRARSMSMHLHGGHHAARHDGQPDRRLIRRGASRTYRFPLRYDGRAQPSSFFWYHDHRMDLTTRNNWMGLQGMFIVDDEHSADLRLPSGARDVPLMVSDRSFTATNQLAPVRRARMVMGPEGMAWTGPNAPPNDANVGNRVLVNGRYAPYLDVTATRYRLRLLNSSAFSSYTFSLSDGRPFVQIGTGNGLLRSPVVRQHILLGPSQRADVVVDFHGAAGQDVVLSSVPRSDGGVGTGSRTGAIMQFRVGGTAADSSRLPASLPAPRRVTPPDRVAKTWRFSLEGDPGTGSWWAINRRAFAPDRVDHRVPLGEVQRWRLVNRSEVTHYVHIHAEQWRTVVRNGKRPPPWERGLEDTWKLDPGETVEVATKFADHTGSFMVHCHMLDHEDHGMMARFKVVRPGRAAIVSRGQGRVSTHGDDHVLLRGGDPERHDKGHGRQHEPTKPADGAAVAPDQRDPREHDHTTHDHGPAHHATGEAVVPNSVVTVSVGGAALLIAWQLLAGRLRGRGRAARRSAAA